MKLIRNKPRAKADLDFVCDYCRKHIQEVGTNREIWAIHKWHNSGLCK